MQWRDIVALNPFLQSSDRLYYNSEKKKWIVKIFPGEVLNIGGTKVYPSVTYEETTITTTEDSNASTTSGMTWWEWVLLVFLLALILVGGILAVSHFRPNNRHNDSNNSTILNPNPNANATANAAIHVNLNNSTPFDLSVQSAILQHMQQGQDRRNKLVDTIVKGAENGSLKKFCVVEDNFAAAASFRGKPEPQPKAEPETKQPEPEKTT